MHISQMMSADADGPFFNVVATPINNAVQSATNIATIVVAQNSTITFNINNQAPLPIIVIEPTRVLTIEGAAIPDINKIEFKNASALRFKYKGTQLEMKAGANEEFSLRYKQVIGLAAVSSYIADKFSASTLSFDFQDYGALRAYSKVDKVLLKKFLKDNYSFELSNLNQLDHYINSHFLEISGICKVEGDTSIYGEASINKLFPPLNGEVISFLGEININFDQGE